MYSKKWKFRMLKLLKILNEMKMIIMAILKRTHTLQIVK